MTSNQIAYLNYKESKRSNQAREAETFRNNFVTSEETHRHNVTTEHLSNLDLNETKRHNLATEGLGALNYKETVRSHKAGERLTGADQSISRSNLAYKYAELSEKVRSNKANEKLGVANYKLGREKAIVDARLRSAQTSDDLLTGAAKRTQMRNQDRKTQAEIAKLNEDTRLNQLKQEYQSMENDMYLIGTVNGFLSSLLGDAVKIGGLIMTK